MGRGSIDITNTNYWGQRKTAVEWEERVSTGSIRKHFENSVVSGVNKV